MVKRINTWQDALATGKAVLDVGDGIEIPLPTSGNFGGAAGPPGAGVPTGGSALQVIRKNEAGTTTEWVTPDKTMVGLSNVNNTADADKPVSTQQAVALAAKAEVSALANYATLTRAADAFTVQRLDRQNGAAANLGRAKAGIDFTDKAEVTVDWSSLASYTKTTSAAVASNQLYVSGAGTAQAWVPFTLQAGERAHISTLLYWKAASANPVYFGVDTAVTPTVADSSSTGVFIGVSGAQSRGSFIGTSAGVTATDEVVIGTNPAVDTTYHITIDIDDSWISFSSRAVGSTTLFHTFKVPRVAIYNINPYIRGTHQFGPVVAIKSLQPTRTKTLAAQTIEAVEHRHIVTRSATGDPWRIQIPKSYDPRKPAPVVLFMHQSLTGNADTPYSESRARPVAAALGDAGYIVASAFDGGDRWGNQASMDNYRQLYEYVRGNFATGPLFLLGVSMGFLPVLNSLVFRQLPTPAAVASIGGVSDLDTLYTGSYAAGIRTAYGIAADGSDYDAKTAGFNPMDRTAAEFRGVPMRFYTSTGDTAVPKASNPDAMSAKVSAYTPEAAVVLGSGAHLDVSQYQPADLLSFFGRYV